MKFSVMPKETSNLKDLKLNTKDKSLKHQQNKITVMSVKMFLFIIERALKNF